VLTGVYWFSCSFSVPWGCSYGAGFPWWSRDDCRVCPSTFSRDARLLVWPQGWHHPAWEKRRQMLGTVWMPFPTTGRGWALWGRAASVPSTQAGRKCPPCFWNFIVSYSWSSWKIGFCVFFLDSLYSNVAKLLMCWEMNIGHADAVNYLFFFLLFLPPFLSVVKVTGMLPIFKGFFPLRLFVGLKRLMGKKKTSFSLYYTTHRFISWLPSCISLEKGSISYFCQQT
jgi:hypothetical protein